MSFLIRIIKIIKEELRILKQEIMMIETREGNTGYYKNDLKELEEDLFQNPFNNTREKEWDFQKEIDEVCCSIKEHIRKTEAMKSEFEKEIDDLIVKLDKVKI